MKIAQFDSNKRMLEELLLMDDIEYAYVCITKKDGTRYISYNGISDDMIVNGELLKFHGLHNTFTGGE